jgi:hypothetical protein
MMLPALNLAQAGIRDAGQLRKLPQRQLGELALAAGGSHVRFISSGL